MNGTCSCAPGQVMSGAYTTIVLFNKSNVRKKLYWKYWKRSIDKPYFASIITHNLSNMSNNTLTRWTVHFLCSCARAGLNNLPNKSNVRKKLYWKYWKQSIDKPYFASIITHNLSNMSNNTLTRWTVHFLCSCAQAGLNNLLTSQMLGRSYIGSIGSDQSISRILPP